jgi:chromosome segregation protein
MKIKRLEIIGFKSFVDKVTFDFPQGITAVVGPNGCGKSNIVDAIRWVMGEQSAKNLRGKSMEDLIFGGSESRKSLGMAEVSLIFSAEDCKVPAKYLNYSEIQVTRRLYRDGESEYFLNKVPCRLMDISELFMDTGAGARAYSIIEQGRIGMILLAKPEERRFLIEEAAGVTKFKSRKQVALKKIDHSRQNLLRLGDIIAELKRQLNSLQRQAKKAEKFRACREELKEIEVSIALKNYSALDSAKNLLFGELADLEMKAASVSGDLENRELALEQRRITLLENEKALSLAQEELYRIKGDMQGFENRLEFQRKEILNLEQQQGRLTDELASLERQLGEAAAELQILEERRGALGCELESAEEALLAGEQNLEEQTSAERDLSMRLDETRRGLFSLMSEIAQSNNQQLVATRRLAAIDERFERNHREKQLFREKHAEVKDHAAALQSTLGALASKKRDTTEALTACMRHEEDLKISLEALERELMTLRDDVSRNKSRLHSLQELEAQFAGYGQGVRNIFTADAFKCSFPGVIADMVEVDEVYELALEAALGDKLQYVVCDGEADAVAAISYLKEISGGRCSMVTKGVEWNPPRTFPTGCQKLLDKVIVREGYHGVAGLLLGDIYLASDFSAALALARRYPHLAFVTPEGEMAGWGGIINGGSTEVARQGLVHKKREIKELVRKVAVEEAMVQEKELQRLHLRSDIAGIEEDLKNIRQNLHMTEIQFVNCEKDHQRALEEYRSLEERMEIKEMEDGQLREEKDTLLHEINNAGLKRSAGEEQKGDIEAETTMLEKKLAAQKHQIGELRERVTDLKVRTAALREKRESMVRAFKRVETLAGDLRTRREDQGVDFERSVREHQRLAAEIAENEKKLKQLSARLLEAEASFVTIKERYDGDALAVQEEEAELKGIRACVEEVRQSISEKNLKKSELAIMTRNLENSLMDKYRLSIATLIQESRETECDDAGLQSRRTELQKYIDEMGDVNLTAIEEYRELEERFKFLSDQKGDLEESLHSLQKAIQRINRTTRKRFLDTFQLVNAKFQEVFPRLFCGGRAELKLTNEEDLLETGIDIVVQPPGKKLQNVSLLSGGEKALTAVALIFSIFLVKPSPFCLLDEVDAPLDDANIGRFNEMVRDMSAFSQFIVITHNKATMTVADTLFGVTMEEPGVSKLVSVRLN